VGSDGRTAVQTLRRAMAVAEKEHTIAHALKDFLEWFIWRNIKKPGQNDESLQYALLEHALSFYI